MSFRQDKVIKSRVARKCQWCDELMPAGTPQVRVSGASGDTGHGSYGPYWRGYFHFECWRAESAYWKDESDAESWPEEAMARGRLDGYKKTQVFPDTLPVLVEGVLR